MNGLSLPAITNHIYRQQRRGAIIWGSVPGMFVWVSAAGFEASYPKLSDRLEFARTLGANAGIRSIFGPARRIETVEGFTAWRSLTAFAVVGAVWGLLLATKVLRGEEEEGRADLLYAGPVTRASGLAHALGGLGVVFAVLFVTLAAWVVTVGVAGGYYSATAGLFFAAVSCSCAGLFMAVGALTSQLVPTRRAASAIGGAAIAAVVLLRAVAEAVDGAHWVSWLSPLGWLDRMHALTGSNPAPWLLVAATTAAPIVVAVWLAARRDLGAAIWRGRDTAEARTALLKSPLGLAVRLSWATLLAWVLGVGIGAVVFGVVSSSISDALASNQIVADIFSRMGSELSARGYIGLTFVMMSAVVSMTAAGFVSAGRKEEAEGRLEIVAAAPIRKWTFLSGRAAVAALGMVAMGVVAGFGGWIGASASGGDLALGTMVMAGLNIVSPGLVVLGIGSLVHGVLPRLTNALTYTAVAWSFLVEMIGSVLDLNRYLLDTSLLHHVAAAPLVDPRWDAAAAMVLLGALGVAVGAAALPRRDLQPG